MKRLKKQIIGLTGGIGSGKSTVSARLAARGAAVLDADAVSRALLEPSAAGDCFAAVVASFGSQILNAEGRIDRGALAAIVFADASRRATLNEIVHPRVREALLIDAARLAQAHPDRPVVLDVPLLFECGMDGSVDETVLVYADDAVRMARIMARDGCTQEHAMLRMGSQMPQEQKRLLADVVFDNSGSLDALFAQVDAWYDALLRDEVEIA